MAQSSPAFTNFSQGELSPRMDGRTDLNIYFRACKKLQNFMVTPQGGAGRRPGTKFVCEVDDSSDVARLIPFEFNVEQTYILEFGDLYFRIIKDGALVESGGTPVKITTPYTAAQVKDLRFTQSADVMFIVHPDHEPREIARTSDTAWTINTIDFRRGPMLDPSIDGSTLTANGRTGTVTITASQNTFASTDVGRLVKLHDGYAEIASFSSATSVTATVVENEDGRSELMPSYTATTISFHEGDPSSTGIEHNDRIQDSAGNFIDQGFKVGMRVTTTGASTGGNNQSGMIIVQVTEDTMLVSPTVDFTDETAGASVTISGDLIADDEYELGAFSETTGYPAHVTLFEERLVFANTFNNPQSLFFSVGGDYTNFTGGIDDDDALTYTIGSNQVNVIRYLASSRSLIVGTSGGEFNVRATEDAPISPTNTVIRQQARHGSASVQPAVVSNKVLFIQRASRKMREIVYDFASDSFLAPDLTILAEHITESGVKEIALQQEPSNNIWAVLNNGKLACLTYRREEDVVAWTSHLLGGSFGSDSFGHVENVAVIPGELDEDEVYFVVKRTINGATKRFVERLSAFDFGTDVTDCFFVDSGITYDGSATTTITGLDHLEGETVSILADGASHPDKVVSSGQITLDRSASKVQVGLGYDSILQTMRLEAGSVQGSAQGKTKRIRDLTVRLFRSVGLLVGESEESLDRISFRSSANPMDQAISLFTGDKDIEFRGGFDPDGFIVIKQNQPLPLTVIAIYPRIQTFDR
jgi:hypothetical protein